jgi:hypothetical protein
MSEKSPYLLDPNRLADVISAIQVMGTYKFYKLPFDGWADRIGGDSSRGSYWQNIFEQHPEFFRLDGPRERASLVWRRQYPKRFQVDDERVLTKVEYGAMDNTAKQRVSRIRLTPADIKTLIDTAISLHARALEEQKERRWWLPLASVIGGLIGGVLGALIGKR